MLNEKQIKVATEIIKGEKSVTEIMQEQGYRRETFYLWKNENKEFQDLLRDLESEAKEEALRIIKASSAKAAKLLVTAVSDGRVSKSRIDAANSILDKAGLRPDFLYKNASEPDRPEQLTSEGIRELMERRKLEAVQ